MDWLHQIVLALLLAIALVMLHALKPRQNLVPKGSMGWPLIGETLSFAHVDSLAFAYPRLRKYGSIFKSHILGTPSIMVTTCGFAKYVLNERNLFTASYPGSITTLVGPRFLAFTDGPRQVFLKKIVQRPLLPETLQKELGTIESLTINHLDSWAGRTIQTTSEMKNFTLHVATFFIFGLKNGPELEEKKLILDMYAKVARGLNSLPVKLPGFTFHKGVKAREIVVEALKKLIAKRRTESVLSGDVLSAFVQCEDEQGTRFEDDEIIDILIGTLFGGHETMAGLLTWLVKFLTEHPNVLATVVAEHEEIRKYKAAGEPLTWAEIKRMKYTVQVVQETLRIVTLLQYSARSPTRDVLYEGYLLPKGWRLFVLIACVHMDPENYSNPTSFNPSRFEVPPKPNTFLPFSGGVHICPGAELAKLVALVFVHHLVMKCRWEAVGPIMGAVFDPFPTPKGGHPIKVEHRENKE